MAELSFQERYRLAKAAAAGRRTSSKKGITVKQKASIVKVQKKNIVTQVKEIAKARVESRGGNRREARYPTLPLNLHEKVKIIVDSRTTVYAKPGADIEAIKAKYSVNKIKRVVDDENKPPLYQF